LVRNFRKRILYRGGGLSKNERQIKFGFRNF
jgi:hypothetical protein